MDNQGAAAPRPYDPPDVRGVLKVSRLADSYGIGQPLRHRTAFVNGPAYRGCSDNDLRGFLDGGFVWGWNQATQVHVRVGRIGVHKKPLYGEEELFRVAQRWALLSLPQGADVIDARLVLEVEDPPPTPARLLLYAVRRDWGPGSGGVYGNNVSAPAVGEVWWNAARHDEDLWGLPGAGFASRSDPRADTDVTPLADVPVDVGGGSLVFQSRALTDYVADRVSAGEPLLFLLKLPDSLEDRPGVFLSLFSANHGDLLNDARRPRLEVDWESRREAERLLWPVHLEHGRTLELPPTPSSPGTWVTSFLPDPKSMAPIVETRSGGAGETTPWATGPRASAPDAEWVQMRIRAVKHPVALGQVFTTELTDTWIVTGPPEEQQVEFLFTSPSGAIHRLDAAYEGGWKWTIRFAPDEVGPWRYRWTQRFCTRPYESPVGRFDVFADTLDTILAALDAVGAAVGGGTMDLQAGQGRLMALEREGMRLLTAETFRGDPGHRLRDAVRDVRSAIWGRPLPDPIPLTSHELRTELAGRTLPEPIPHGRSYGVHLDGDPPPQRKRASGGVGARMVRWLRGRLP